MMRVANRVTVRVFALAVALILSACANFDEFTAETSVNWPGDREVPHHAVTLGFGIVADLPETWTASMIKDVARSETILGCQVRTGRLLEERSFLSLGVSLNHRACDVEQTSQFPRYARVENAQAAREVETFEAPLGPATMFIESSEWCSKVTEINGVPVDDPRDECSTHHNRVVLIEMESPTNPDFPHLQMSWIESSGDGNVIKDKELLKAIAMALRT